MKRLPILLCVLALAVTLLPAAGGNLPDFIECVTFKVDGETIWIPFGHKVPVADGLALSAATTAAAHQYLLTDPGNPVVQSRAQRLLQASVEQSCGDSVGGLCIARVGPYGQYKIYGCSGSCGGAGCCTIRAAE